MADVLEEAGIEVDRHEDVNGKPPSVNYLDYTEYIKEGGFGQQVRTHQDSSRDE